MPVGGQSVDVFVARQPIFDSESQVLGYELLFRNGVENFFQGTDPDAATLDVIGNSFWEIGLDDLTDGKQGFINFTQNLLVQEIASVLPADQIVIEILEDVQPEPKVIAACRRLREAGFTLAIDDMILDRSDSPFLDLAHIVKVDFMATTPRDRERMCKAFKKRGLKTLAEKVETDDEYQQARIWGYDYFQGYFFSKPVIRSGKAMSASKISCLRLLEAVNRPEISIDQLEEVIKHDTSLAYKLLRLINSAWFGFRREIESVRHALVLLGRTEICKWVSLATLRQMSTDKPQELIVRSMVRAKVAEELGRRVIGKDRASELFLMGMFSVLDALTDLPLEEVLKQLPLRQEVVDALLGKPSPFLPICGVVLAYETGDWKALATAAADLQGPTDDLHQVFTDAWKWARQALVIS